MPESKETTLLSVKAISAEQKVDNIKKVQVEIGQISLAHDGHPEHTEDLNEENLRFGLETVAKNTPFEKTIFEIKKVAGNHWKITGVEV